MNKDIFIITQRLESYRYKFYELLNEKYNDRIIGIHSNNIPTNLNFRSIQLKKLSVINLQFQKKIISIVCKLKPRVVIAEFDLHVISNVILLFICKLLKIKFIWWGIGLGKNKKLYFIRKLLIRISDGVIVYEDSSKSKLTQIGVNPNKIKVMQNTIYVSDPEFNSEMLDKKNLMVIGKLDKRKGVEDLLIAFAEVSQKLKLIESIIIIGDGPEKNYLYNLCEKYNIKNRVKFKGKILDEEILKKEFHKSFATIHPQQAGLSVLHSFSYGVPFITSKNTITGGEADNIKNNLTGILYEGGIDQLKDIIIDIDLNPTKYHNMGFNAYNYYMSSRTMNKMVNNYYNSILNLSL